MTWTITWGEHVITSDDVTSTDLSSLELVHGAPGWHWADPTAGPTYMKMLVAVVLLRIDGTPVEQTVDALNALSANELRSLLVEG